MTRRIATSVLGLVSLAVLLGGNRLAAAEPNDKPITMRSLLGEMIDRNTVARLPHPQYVCKQASSYDRRQTDPADIKTWFGNNDYEQFIRIEENEGRREWVIMEHKGPGSLVRLWTPLDVSRKNQVIRFYFDGAKTPAITVKLNDLLSGRSFVKPPFAFVASDEQAIEGVAGDLYLPIPFAEGCKITLDGVPFYYAINFRAYEPCTKIKTFTMDDYKAADAALKQSARVLKDLVNEAEGKESRKEGRIEPGAELAINLPVGANAVRRLQVQIDPHDAPQVLRSAVLEASFDGQPTVWCPFGEFFGCGTRLNPVKDWYRSVEKDGTLTVQWVMPYRKSARLFVKNVGKRAISVKLATTTGPWQWDDRSMYFHANWRRQYPIKTKKAAGTVDWNYIDLRGRGVYVGDTLTVFNPVADWYGEGDERIYVDGEKLPSHMGTGTEDYYGYAWGMAHEFSSPFISMPKRDSQGRGDWRGYTTTSRVRLLDGIPCQHSLKMDMEIWHWAATTMDYAAGIFWYARSGATCNRGPASDEAARELLH